MWHHVIRKSHDATQEKCLQVVHFNSEKFCKPEVSNCLGARGEKPVRVTYKMCAKLLRLAEYAECQIFSIIAGNAELFLSGLNRRFFHLIYLG